MIIIYLSNHKSFENIWEHLSVGKPKHFGIYLHRTSLVTFHSFHYGMVSKKITHFSIVEEESMVWRVSLSRSGIMSTLSRCCWWWCWCWIVRCSKGRESYENVTVGNQSFIFIFVSRVFQHHHLKPCNQNPCTPPFYCTGPTRCA